MLAYLFVVVFVAFASGGPVECPNAPQDCSINRADEGQREVELFHKADTNNDDMLTRTELDAIFLMFDANNDSQITPTEFVDDWVTKFQIGGTEEGNTLFTKADTNDDGLIDAKDIPAIFAYFDMNGNGLVDISEFLTQWGALETDPSGESNISVDLDG